MVIVMMTVCLVLLFYLMSRGSGNVNPEMGEDDEHKRNAAAGKHQFWQTMDFTEPWNK